MVKKADKPVRVEGVPAWRYYKVRLRILNRLYGGLPGNPDLIAGFLQGKGKSPEDIAKLAPQIAAELPKQSEDRSEEGILTVFKRDAENTPFIETRQIKAMMKESVSASQMWRRATLFGLRSRIGDNIFPKGEGGDDLTQIYLYREGKKLTQPDGKQPSVGHVRTAMGEKSILKVSEYVEKAEIQFDLKVMGDMVTPVVLTEILAYGEELGLGANRSTEAGKFKVLEIKETNEPK